MQSVFETGGAAASLPLPVASPTSPHLLDASMFWNPAGGVHRMLGAKAVTLRRAGWRHTLLAPRAAAAGGIDAGGITLPASGGYRLVWNRVGAAALIERARPDIVEAADPYTLAWSTLDACRRLDIPAVAFCHSNLPALAARLVGGASAALTSRGRWAAQRAQRYLVGLYERFDLVLAPSSAMTQALRAWGVPRVVHQPLGVDCSVFTPRAGDPVWRRQLLGQLELDADTRLLLYCGRFAPEKNLDVLTAAVQLLGPGHALLAIGSGPRPPRGAQVRVLTPDSCDARLARLLASCDVFVHAGNQETFGLAALEAMACGTPVVASACAGLGELVGNGAGRTVASLRASEWADAIDASLRDRSPTLTFKALKRARAHDWSRVFEPLLGRYRQLIKAPRPQPFQATSGPSLGPGW